MRIALSTGGGDAPRLNIVTVPLTDALKTPKRVEIDHDTILTARATGISFGD